MSDLLRGYLDNHDEDPIREALAACPDPYTYSILYEVLAYEACNWMTFDRQGKCDFHCLFGIPLTLHAPEEQIASSWKPSEWDPNTNEQDLVELRRILDKTGVTAGMQDVAILPHLVDPDDVMNLDFSDMPQLAADLVHHPAEIMANGKLPHRPWRSAAGGAQCRVMVMASRSRSLPRGLDAHNERCAVTLSEWAARCFGIPSSLCVVASSPERLVSLLAGKGLNMFNCARLVHLLGHSLPEGPRPVSPFVAVVAVATDPCQGELKFLQGDASSVWKLHGRADWAEELQTLGALLPDPLARFVRVQLGLGRARDSDLD